MSYYSSSNSGGGSGRGNGHGYHQQQDRDRGRGQQNNRQYNNSGNYYGREGGGRSNQSQQYHDNNRRDHGRQHNERDERYGSTSSSSSGGGGGGGVHYDRGRSRSRSREINYHHHGRDSSSGRGYGDRHRSSGPYGGGAGGKRGVVPRKKEMMVTTNCFKVEFTAKAIELIMYDMKVYNAKRVCLNPNTASSEPPEYKFIPKDSNKPMDTKRAAIFIERILTKMKSDKQLPFFFVHRGSLGYSPVPLFKKEDADNVNEGRVDEMGQSKEHRYGTYVCKTLAFVMAHTLVYMMNRYSNNFMNNVSLQESWRSLYHLVCQ